MEIEFNYCGNKNICELYDFDKNEFIHVLKIIYNINFSDDYRTQRTYRYNIQDWFTPLYFTHNSYNLLFLLKKETIIKLMSFYKLETSPLFKDVAIFVENNIDKLINEEIIKSIIK